MALSNDMARLFEEISSECVSIPEGYFRMGSDRNRNECPIHDTYVNAFRVSKFLITNEQYAIFLNESDILNEIDGLYLYLNTFSEKSRIYPDGGRYYIRKGYEKHPVTLVTWEGAYNFCLSLGGRLPYESEWEKAAKGGLDHIYPWGTDRPDTSFANFGENVGETTNVGAYPPNEFGLYDLAGNVWEWCMDWYGPRYDLSVDSGVNSTSQGPQQGDSKVIRGGSYSYDDSCLRCSKRSRKWFRVGSTNTGFRIVFDK